MDTIIFYPKFNDELYVELLRNYKKIIFSNFAFNEDVYKNICDKYIIQLIILKKYDK